MRIQGSSPSANNTHIGSAYEMGWAVRWLSRPAAHHSLRDLKTLQRVNFPLNVRISEAVHLGITAVPPCQNRLSHHLNVCIILTSFPFPKCHRCVYRWNASSFCLFNCLKSFHSLVSQPRSDITGRPLESLPQTTNFSSLIANIRPSRGMLRSPLFWDSLPCYTSRYISTHSKIPLSHALSEA